MLGCGHCCDYAPSLSFLLLPHHPFLCLSPSFLWPPPSSLDLVMLICSVIGRFSLNAIVWGPVVCVILLVNHHLPLTRELDSWVVWSYFPPSFFVTGPFFSSWSWRTGSMVSSLPPLCLLCECPELCFELWAISPQLLSSVYLRNMNSVSLRLEQCHLMCYRCICERHSDSLLFGVKNATCMHIYIYIYIYTHTHTHTHTCKYNTYFIVHM